MDGPYLAKEINRLLAFSGDSAHHFYDNDHWGSSMIELRNVTKTYGEPGTPGCVEVLKGISLSITPGQSMAIVGPSAAARVRC